MVNTNLMDDCDHDKLVLFPDYSSSGLWCAVCGVGFGDPSKDFPSLPRGLIDAVEVWNDCWDHWSSYGVGDKAYVQSLINSSGQYLADLVNAHYPCVFDVRRSELEDRAVR